MDTIFNIIDSIFSTIGRGLSALLDWALGITTPDHSLNASFGTESDFLKRSNTGFCLTGTKSLSAKSSYENAIISGKTGVKKSVTVLIPSILKMEGSMVIHDPSSELLNATGGALEARGYEIAILDFSKPERSLNFNPLQRAIHSTSEINKLSEILIRATLGKGSSDKFWELQARELLSMLCQILKTQDRSYQNLANVRHLLFLLGGDPEKVDSLFVRNTVNNPLLLNQYRAFASYNSKVSTSIIATCQSALQLLSDESIAAVTSKTDTLELNEFRERKIALFVQNNVSDMGYYAPLVSIFFTQFFKSVMSKLPDETAHDIFFLIDEASSIRLPSLANTISNIRKYRAGMLLVFQSALPQLTENYGMQDARTILENCVTKMYFAGQDLNTARELQDILGRYTYLDEKGLERQRHLQTSDEIIHMNPEEALILQGFRKPVKVQLKPYYQQRKLRKLTELPPPEIISTTNAGDLPLLPL